MEYDIIAVMLSVVLPLYPALFVIYQKIGKYDMMCEELEKLRDEHDRIVKGEGMHGTGNHSDS
jgi:Na+-transporting NADH:ubiquinone oxidoreductase subunit NqrB